MSADTVTSARDGEARWLLLGLLGAVLIFAAQMRFPSLARDSIWWDEAATLNQVDGSFAEIFTRTARDTYPPGYNVFAWVSIHIFGESDLALRLPAALMQWLDIVATYWLGRISAGRIAGLVAATFVAISPFTLFYAQEARPYAMLMLTATLFAGLTLTMFRAPSIMKSALLALTGAALLYSHPYGTLVWISGALATAGILALDPTTRKALWYLAAAHAVMAAAFAPWVGTLLGVSKRLAEHGFWIDRPTLGTGLLDVADTTGSPQVALLMLALIASSVLLWRQPLPPQSLTGHVSPESAPRTVALLAALAVGPIAIGFIVSQITTPIFISRYISCALPAIAVLAGTGAGKLLTTPKRLVIGELLFLGIASSSFLTNTSHEHHWDWRGLSHYLHDQFGDSDCIVDPGVLAAKLINLYVGRELKCIVVIPTDGTPAHIKDATERVFVPIGYTSLTEDVATAALGPGWTSTVTNFGDVPLITYTRQHPPDPLAH